MTKEQAISAWIDEDACCQGKVDVKRLMNRIFNDFKEELDKAKKESYLSAYNDCYTLLTGKDKR